MDQSLCDACARMNIEELVSQHGFALHKNLLNLYKSVRTCRLCRHVLSSLKPLLPLDLRSLPCRHAMRHLSSESSRSSLSESNQKLLATQQARAFYGQHNHPKHGLTIVVSDVDSEAPSERERSIPWLLMRTLPGEPAQRSGTKTARLIPESTSSLTSAVHALEWLKECLLSKDCFEGCTHIIDNDLQKCLAKTHGNNKKLESLSLSEGLGVSL